MTKKCNIFIIFGEISEFHQKLLGPCDPKSVYYCIRLNKWNLFFIVCLIRIHYLTLIVVFNYMMLWPLHCKIIEQSIHKKGSSQIHLEIFFT